MNIMTNGEITLRALEPDDVELLYYWENQSEIWRVSNSTAPVSKYVLANYIKNSDKDIWDVKSQRLVIDNAEKEAVGTIEMFDFEPYHSRAGIGVLVFSEENRRHGIAKQAITIFENYILNTVGVTMLYANVAADNEASIALFKKLNYEIAGIRKRWLRVDADRWSDEIMFQKIM